MENFEIPPQYSLGFGRRFIPLEDRPYGEYVGKTILIEGNMTGVFEGSHQSPGGTVCHFSEWIYKNKIHQGHAEITVHGNPRVLSSNKHLRDYLNENGTNSPASQTESKIIRL